MAGELVLSVGRLKTRVGQWSRLLLQIHTLVSRRGVLVLVAVHRVINATALLDLFCNVDEAFPLRGERLKLLGDRL